MKALTSIRWMIALAALATLGGCCLCLEGARYEYRYRVFQSKAEMPSMLEGPVGTDVLIQRFMPPAEINRDMDQLTLEGFKLRKIERVAETPYYTFILRRPVVGKMRPMKAPTEFCGVYQVQLPGNGNDFYAFQPTYFGYTIVRFQSGAAPEIIETKWDGDKLVGDDDGTHHLFVLSGDGFAIVHSVERMLADRLERTIVNARRVHTGKP